MKNNSYVEKTESLISVFSMVKKSNKSLFLSQSQLCEAAVADALRKWASNHDGRELDIARYVFIKMNEAVEEENGKRPKEIKLSYSKGLSGHVLAQVLSARDDIILIAPSSKIAVDGEYPPDMLKNFPFGLYQKPGKTTGTYIVTNDANGGIAEIARRYQPNLKKQEIQEIMDLLRTMLLAKPECSNPYLVPVNNGIWDMESRKLYPFTPDIVFTSKIGTDLNFTAVNPVFNIAQDGSKWDVNEWLHTMGDDEFVFSLWEVIQAACLRLAPRNKMVLFFSTVGNNGKGTLCQLIRNLIGEDVTVNIPLEDFSKRFGLSKLPNASAIITDENNVGSFGKGWANLKAVITSDPVTIEQKYQNSYDYSFHGLVLQCINDYIKGNDKTGSFQRRLHIIQFNHSFTGAEKKYIKEDLIYRKEVLEYILKVVLVDMPYRDSFTETSQTKAALHGYLLNSNSVDSFLEEVLSQCVWNLLPATDLLYEAYKSWYKKTSPSGNTIGRNEFIDSVKDYVIRKTKNDPDFEWEWTDSCRWKNYIDFSVNEPLVTNYNVYPFMGIYDAIRYFTSVDYSKLSDKYSGLKRRNCNVNSAQGTPANDEEK